MRAKFAWGTQKRPDLYIRTQDWRASIGRHQAPLLWRRNTTSTMSKTIPAPGTTVILRQNNKENPFTWDYNNAKPEYTECFCLVLRETEREVVLQLKGKNLEAYIPRKFFTSKGSQLDVSPPIISIPMDFIIESLPIWQKKNDKEKPRLSWKISK